LHSVSAFFTAYSARRGADRVEAVALVVSEGEGTDPVLRFVVVGEDGRASFARPDELDLYGAYEQPADEG
jgi:hypothetical protein